VGALPVRKKKDKKASADCDYNKHAKKVFVVNKERKSRNEAHLDSMRE
jgi:hypothetical protein